MALCSWLSFVDRQVLAVLAPTILKDTGMSAADFGNIVFFSGRWYPAMRCRRSLPA